MTQLAVSLLGAGRMGQEILRAMSESPDQFRLTGLWARPQSAIHKQPLQDYVGHAADGVSSTTDLGAALRGSAVAIDFTLPEATSSIVVAARATGVPLVCGVSGIASTDLEKLQDAAADIPVFFARNMSIGIALLQQCVASASAVLGTGYEIVIDDLHHAQKKDAPSGTALLLGETAAAARGQKFEEVCHYAPEGGAKPAPADIEFRVRREGSYPGSHQIRFSSASEQLTFGHTVSDRRVFAEGALRAACWLAGRPPGFYGMQDLLADLNPR